MSSIVIGGGVTQLRVLSRLGPRRGIASGSGATSLPSFDPRDRSSWHGEEVIRGLTRNLGYRRSAETWLRAQLEDQRIDIVFAQEALPSLLAAPPHGYQLVAGREEPNAATGRTSVLLVRNELAIDTEAPDPRPFAALGTYAATATLVHGGGSICLASVHASPSVVPPEKRKPEFEIRSCEREPWWADAFLAELRALIGRGLTDAIIAGDLNQARAYDKAMNHVCGGELLDGIASAGVIDVTSRDWNEIERPTRRSPDYQLDRVFATQPLANRVRVEDVELQHDGVSDHAAVEFTLDL